MKYVFVVNPMAGNENSLAQIKAEISKLEEREQCEVYCTAGINDATNFVRKYSVSEDEKVLFIACGGDGTLNEVMNGAAGRKNVSVTCYPCGSGNDFVKVFGGSERFLDLPQLLHGRDHPLDLLKVGDRYSNNVVNFGFDTTVAIKVNEDRARTGHGSKSSYTKGIIKALITSMNNSAKVWADGKLLNPDGKLLLCTVANGQYVGGSFKCAPKAKIDDGLIEVCLVKPISRLRFVKLLSPYTNGEHLDREDLKDIMCYVQATKVDVEAPEGFAYSLDGEIIYDNKFTVEIVKHAISFAVPE
ncbi:MAG: diacylglycerol kinase family lipid kinase [Erysipelotrichaceae bacterium]|nr:diacylglycerol kinase family lipid kinase [Erysipelotrichaceae bacterium]